MKPIMLRFAALAALVFLFAGTAHAAGVVSVNSFAVSPLSSQHAYAVGLSWDMPNAAGGTISLECAANSGLSVKTQDGTELCNASMRVAGSTGNASVTIYNVSGTTKQLTFTIVPFDSTDGIFANLQRSAQANVYTAAQTITDFSLSSTGIGSGGTETLTWTGIYIPGVNLQFDCNPNLTVSSGGTQLACGVPAFSSDLPVSGSQTVTVVNKSNADQQITARAIPAIAAGVYDASHAIGATFNVAPPPAAAAGTDKIGVTSFGASTTGALVSGSTLNLSWATQNAAGGNLQFVCDTPLRLTTMIGGATTTIVCNNGNAFADPLPANGTMSISVTNSYFYAQPLTVMFLPQDASGIYFSQYAKSLSFSVQQPGAAPVSAPAALAPVSAPAAASSTAPSGLRIPLVKPLWRGVSDLQVKALQQFLSLDANIYPLGLVTGYFGPATEAAVENLQVKYGLAKVGDPGYGFVGPLTRAKINSLIVP